MYHVLFDVIVANEVPVTTLRAYIFLSRRIRKGVLIRRNITSYLCNTTVGCQQFRKDPRKRPRRIMFERNYSFFHHCVLSKKMFQNSSLSKPKWGGGGGGGGVRPPRSDGTYRNYELKRAC